LDDVLGGGPFITIPGPGFGGAGLGGAGLGGGLGFGVGLGFVCDSDLFICEML